jgi:hypothetical protein
MPAEIGPKRDCALARAGCYFDGSLTMCGTEVFALRSERCVRAIAIVARAFPGVSALWLVTSVIDISGILPRSLHTIACDNTKRLRKTRRRADPFLRWRRDGLLRFALRNDAEMAMQPTIVIPAHAGIQYAAASRFNY